MHEHDPSRRADGTLKPLAEQKSRQAIADVSDAQQRDRWSQGVFNGAADHSSAGLVAATSAAYQTGAAPRAPDPLPVHRFAVYLSPAPDTAWWKAGSSWLGRDAATGAVLSQPLIPGVSMSMQQRLTAAPRRYGWHATLKAPFALAEDADAVMLQGRLTALCRERRPFPLRLRVARLNDFLALVPDEDSRDIDALARSCVSHLHALAAPLSPAELTRRRAAGLTPDEDKLLLRWSYPYVMDHFRLHFSLTGSLRDVSPDTVDALRDAAEHCFAALPPLRVDAVSLFVEPTPGADFLFIDRMELGA